MEALRIRSGKDLLRKINARNQGAYELTREYESKGRIGRFVMLQDPEVRRQIEYVQAMESIPAAIHSAQQNEGRILFPSNL